ncbi:MAG: N-acetylmuramoyl-L-alanine amidase [Clostridia bacterium]
MIRFKGRVRKRGIILTAAATALAVLVIIFIVRACTPSREIDRLATEALGIPVHNVILPKGNIARPGIEREIKYVVIHETDNTARGSGARRHSDFLQNNNTSKTSWHYTVDDHEIYHHIPNNEIAWHAGDMRNKDGGNLNGIGVELCVNSDGDFEKTFDNAARLTAYLLNEYDLSVDDVRQHADFIDKNCPEHIRDSNRMDEFKSLVKKYMN